MDKRNVLMLTTCKDHDDNLTDTVNKKRETDECIKKPRCVLLYNKTKTKKEFTFMTRCLLIIQRWREESNGGEKF